MAAQHKNMKRIFELEWMLHKIKGKSNKHLERKVIISELEELSKQVKRNE